MTIWNFRIIRHDEPSDGEIWFGLHEVYYTENGEIENWTENPILVGDSVEDIAREVGHIAHDLKRFPEAVSLAILLKRKKDGEDE